DRTNIMVGYHQTNQKTDTGKTLTRWPVLVDHNKQNDAVPAMMGSEADAHHAHFLNSNRVQPV
ncbi:MAG: hypothetical protein E6850_25485, partial [Leclercia adecarboxylata]|nr:hypothetical protein [Leclercia adecarboxylata]